jgi:drug/metabolite transporter (DMT)-like permease
MNRAYGIRIKKSFVSEEHWYAINEYGGKLFFVFGAFLLGFSCLTWNYAPSPVSLYAPLYLIFPFLGMVPIIFLINRFSKKMPEK